MNDQPSASPEKTWRSLSQLAVLVIICLLFPVIPFILAGPFLEQQFEQAIRATQSPNFLLGATSLVLAVDIFLPVPSSAVISYCGAKCGVGSAVLAATLGLTVGGMIGYELSRFFGSRFLAAFAHPADVTRMESLAGRCGGLTTLATRPLPILGETAVLLAGCLKLNRLIFYLALVSANLLVALAYAAFGYWWGAEHSLAVMLIVSVLFPLLLTFIFRGILKRKGGRLRSFSHPE